ncbi:MAG: hypothetical protein ACSLEW_09055 [Nocardioides sp.]
MLRPKWLTVTGPVQTDLLNIAGHELRPVRVEHNSPQYAAQNRLDFEAAITHRPEPRGGGVVM